jgi:hypothetical protein
MSILNMTQMKLHSLHRSSTSRLVDRNGRRLYPTQHVRRIWPTNGLLDRGLFLMFILSQRYIPVQQLVLTYIQVKSE